MSYRAENRTLPERLGRIERRLRALERLFSRPSGEDGATVLNGSGAPAASDGVDGDFWIDTSSWVIYGPKTEGAWGVGTSLVGASGTPGTPGTPGANGLSVLNGVVPPGPGDGVDGEFWIDTATSTLYGPKAAGVWPAGVSLIGPATGPAGGDLTGTYPNPTLAVARIPSSLIDAKGDLIVGSADDTPSRLPVGDDYLPPVARSSEAVGLAYGVPTTAIGIYPDNVYYLLNKASGTQSTSTVTTTANRIVAWRLEIQEPITIDGLFIYVNTGAAGAKWRIGIYACDPLTGLPVDVPIVEDAEIDASTGSVYKTDSFAASPVIAPGVYWGVLASNSSATAYRISSATQIDVGIGSASNNVWGTYVAVWTYSSAGLPDASGLSFGGQNSAAPYVRWKVRR